MAPCSIYSKILIQYIFLLDCTISSFFVWKYWAYEGASSEKFLPPSSSVRWKRKKPMLEAAMVNNLCTENNWHRCCSNGIGPRSAVEPYWTVHLESSPSGVVLYSRDSRRLEQFSGILNGQHHRYLQRMLFSSFEGREALWTKLTTYECCRCWLRQWESILPRCFYTALLWLQVATFLWRSAFAHSQHSHALSQL